MDLLRIIGIPAGIFAAIGLLAAILLTVAAKLLAVKENPQITAVNEALPQANCGACGFAGCSDYARAVAEHRAPVNLCKPGGTDTAARLAEITGAEALRVTPEIAVLHCRGDCKAAVQKYIFSGIESCSGAKRRFGGSSKCTYGCIGLGDCVRACSSGAISLKNGLADIQPGKCVACGLCISACPNHLISLRPTAKHMDVRCASPASGKTVKAVCSHGCIGCRLCERKCLSHAIRVVNNLAVIDYEKCTGCGVCRDHCPTGAITCCEDTN